MRCFSSTHRRSDVSRLLDKFARNPLKGNLCPLFNFFRLFVITKLLSAGDATLANTQRMGIVSVATVTSVSISSIFGSALRMASA